MYPVALVDGGKLIGNNPTNDGGKGDDLASDCSPTDSLLVMAKSKPLPKKVSCKCGEFCLMELSRRCVVCYSSE